MGATASRCSRVAEESEGGKRQLTYSLVIPAHNEAVRISPTLESYCAAWDHELKETGTHYEIIVVANGCSDKTAQVVKEIGETSTIDGDLRLIRLSEGNKGLAVLAGFLFARGSTVGFTDADGSIDPHIMLDIMRCANEKHVVAIGSKYHPEAHASRNQRAYRLIASRCWNLLVRCVLGLQVRDTQAGAKAMPLGCARGILEYVLPCNFAFDVSLLFEAQQAGYRIEELPLEWTHMDGSTFSVFRQAPKMFGALMRIRFASLLRWHTATRVERVLLSSNLVADKRSSLRYTHSSAGDVSSTDCGDEKGLE